MVCKQKILAEIQHLYIYCKSEMIERFSLLNYVNIIFTLKSRLKDFARLENRNREN